jgi:TatD DNase family protein
MLIDTHVHLNFNAYKEDIDQVIKRILENDIWIINIGIQYETSKKAVEIAKNYPQGVYAAIGLHPIYLETGLVKIKKDKEEIENEIKKEDFDYEKYKELAKSEKVVAIGEIGLDYYWKPKTKRKLNLLKKNKKLFLAIRIS